MWIKQRNVRNYPDHSFSLRNRFWTNISTNKKKSCVPIQTESIWCSLYSFIRLHISAWFHLHLERQRKWNTTKQLPAAKRQIHLTCMISILIQVPKHKVKIFTKLHQMPVDWMNLQNAIYSDLLLFLNSGGNIICPSKVKWNLNSIGGWLGAHCTLFIHVHDLRLILILHCIRIFTQRYI